MKNSLFNEVLESLASTLTPEAILALRPSEEVQQRVRYLLEQDHKGILSETEQFELDDYQQVDQFVALLKAKVRNRISSHQHPQHSCVESALTSLG